MDITEKAGGFAFNSMQYTDEEDLTGADTVLNNDNQLFLYKAVDTYGVSGTAQIFWAAVSCERFFDGLAKTVEHIRSANSARRVYLEFIDESFEKKLLELGFRGKSEWVDFWIDDLSAMPDIKAEEYIIRAAGADEYHALGEVTRSCRGRSRGFDGQTDDEMKEWLESEDSCLLAAEIDGMAAGICYCKLYGFESLNGTVCWIRELAVKPEYQHRGIGRALLRHGLDFGISNGAKRSFLACDTENLGAIRLYERFTFKRMPGRGQINMELIL